ncbi:MAG: chromate efflux transporter [Siculibacillus sp.]|nr:chromate efflux transporter [Siculibacillus sp.]
MTDIAPPAARPTFAEALRVWAKVGLLGFGGPAGQIALLHREVVEIRGWISEARFLHALNFCMLLPGPEAQQLATYLGWMLHGTRGGVAAGTLFVLPGFLVILALSTFYALFRSTTWVDGLFFGLKAAVLAVVAEALLKVARRALKGRAALALALVAFAALFVFAVPFPLVVLGAGLFGFLAARLAPGRFFVAGATGGATEAVAAARPDDGLGAALRTLLVWGGVWAAPALVVVAIFGLGSTFATLAGYFSQMAVVTFGGAYAVLAWVSQAAVESFGWLAPGEMVDGLALAETTPGPLILVLAFVGFLAGFRDPAGLAPLLGGVLGAAITTWVTFAPSFLWIFLGAPHVERLRGNRGFAAALAAIGAAVVGVIGNLALWFALHVLFREVGRFDLGPLSFAVPVPTSLDPEALGLVVVAFVALFRVRLGLLATLSLCGGLGLALRAIG